MTKAVIASGDYAGLHEEVVNVIESARRRVARNVNAAYWKFARRMVARKQGGQTLIARLAEDLTRRFGHGSGKANLASMRAF